MPKDSRINALSILRIVAALPMFLLSSAAFVRADSVCLLDGDRAAIEARLSLIAAARCSIDAAYFEIHDDDIGRLFTQTLVQAARQGVKVRLLVDGANNLLGKATQTAIVESGVELREYHAASWSRLHSSPYRMHDKLLVVDGEQLIVGGRNISSAFFGAGSKRRFSDRDVLIAGRAAQHAAAYFQSVWDCPDVTPVRSGHGWLSALQPPNVWQIGSQIEDKSWLHSLCQRLKLARTDGDHRSGVAANPSCCESSTECFEVPEGNIRFLHHAGDGANSCCDISAQLLALIREARESIVIETPYLVLTDEFECALGAARARGVDVHIITNSIASTNKLLAQAGYECQKKKLLKMGIHLWEYQGPSILHAKCWVVDDCALIGSYNLDCRAALYDTQTAVIVRDRSVARQLLTGIVSRHQANSVQPTVGGDVVDSHQVENRPSIVRKALVHAMRPLVPLVKRHL